MQLTTLLALAPFLGAVVAVPSRAHEKFHHKKRDITWFTVTSEVVETVYETTTVWVAPGQASPSAAPSPASPSVPAVASPSPPAASPSPPAASPSPPAAATSSGLVGLQSPSSPAAQSPAPQSPAPVQSPSPAPASPSPAPASPSPAPVQSPSPAQPSQPAQPSGGSGGGSFPVTTQPGASSPDGPCTPGQPCTGEGTFYAVGEGACGSTSTDSEMVVALPVQIMGSASSGGSPNPLCGRSVMVTLFSGGPQVKASVVDKCMGCNTAYSLDMSTGLFDALGGDQNKGRYPDISWYWTN